jgi:hypothetical protein
LNEGLMSLSEFEWRERARSVESATAIDRLDLGARCGRAPAASWYWT